MTRFIHDRFAKEYLEELLSPIGTVNVGRDVTSEVREIDVYFTFFNLKSKVQNLKSIDAHSIESIGR